MTREELLESHIMIGDSLDPKRMKYFCDLGFKLLYYIYERVPVLIYVGNLKVAHPADKIKNRYRLISEKDVPNLQITYCNGLLYHYKWINGIKDIANIVTVHFYKYD